MNDVFKEQMVKKLPSTKDRLIKAGAVLLGIVLLLVSMMFEVLMSFIPFIFAAIVFGIWYVFGLFHIEHEYILTNGELDIDVIYDKRRRKRVFSGDLKQIEIMCHMSDHSYDPDFRSADATKDCSSGKESNNTYMFLASYKGKKLKIIFEPNDDMLRLMTPYLGQRRFKKKQ